MVPGTRPSHRREEAIPLSDPELSPAEEARLRRLLAEARHTEPLPGDVAERLDGVLAELAAHGRESPTRVVRLDSRRRRRSVAGLVAAAAAVVAVGIAVPRIDLGSGALETTTADEAPASTEPDRDGVHAATPQDTRDPSRAGGTPGKESADAATGQADGALEFSRDRLDEQLAGLTPLTPQADQGVACWDRAWGAGTRVAATYDGQEAVVVLREPSASHQRIELFVCGRREPVGSVRVPLP